jgi:hypothetical protein
MGISRQLVVKFLGDSSQLQGVYSAVTKDAQKFDKEIKKHGVSMQAVGKIMLAVGGTITGAMAATVVAVSKTGVEVDKFSKQTGVSREEIQKLGYAALQEHASMEQLASGLIKLSKNMYDASMGTGEAKDTFDSLGISVKNSDGSLRNSSDVLLDVADRFKNMTNETEMSGAAMKIFGKSGAELVPFLRMGRDGIEELKKEAERLGIVMSEDSVKNMKAFDDSMTAVKAGVGGFGTQIASALIPYMNKLADGLKTALEWFNKIPGPIKQVVIVGTALAGVIALISGAFIVLGPTILAALTAAWPFIAAAGALGAAGVLVYNSWNKVAAFFMTVWDKIAADAKIVWGGIRTLILGEIALILKGLQAMTGWIPGWGDKLKSAVSAVEKQLHAAVSDIQTGYTARSKNRYQEHYNWMVKKNEKKNKDIQDQEDDANNTKNQKTKEQLEKEKKLAEERAKIEEQADQALLQTKLQSTKNIDEQLELQLELLRKNKKKELDEATKVGASTAKIEAKYTLEETQIRKQAADRKIEIEKDLQKQLLNSQSDLTENLTEQKNIRLKLLEMERDEAIKKAEEQGKGVEEIKKIYANRTAAIEKSYNDGIKKVSAVIKKELLSSQQSLTKNLLEQKNAQLDLLKLEEDAAAEQAENEGKSAEYIATLHQIYSNRKLVVEQDYNDSMDELKRQQNADLLALDEEYYDSIASSERHSYSERLQAQKESWRLRFKQLDDERKEAIRVAEEKGESVKAVEELYDKKSRNLLEQQKDQYYQVGLQMARSFTGFTDAIISGSSTLGESLRDMLVSIINTIEQQVIAKAIAAEAIAYADSWWSLGSSLSSLAVVASKVWPAVAALEALKVGAYALAEGALVTGPTLAMVGEGRSDEVVLPLDDRTFEMLGKSIVKNQTSNTTNNNQSQSQVYNDNRTINLGRYVDKSGLKKLARDLDPIFTAEDKRKGKK